MKRMRLLRTISYASLLSAMVITNASCGFNGEQSNQEQNLSDTVQNIVNDVPGSMESEAVLDYDIPIQLPGIIADRDGYSSLEVKYAWFVADEVPAVFNLCNADTGEVILEISPSDVIYDEQNNCYRAKIDFEDITEAGKYYIETADYGRSYSFVISDTFFEDKYDALLEQEYEKLNDGTASLDEVYSLLYSYERYSRALPDYDNENIRLAEELNDWVAGYLEKLTGVEATELGDSEKCLAAAVLAKYYYVSEKSDINADNCGSEALEEAEKIYEEIKNNSIPEDIRFLALAELYRSTGQKIYSEEIISHENYLTNLTEPYSSEYILMGAMTYMMTNRSVSRSLCDEFMQNLLDSCEKISKEKELLAPYNPEREDTEVILADAEQLVAMNYILDGYQYNELITNIVHYTAGRNYEGYVCDIDKDYPEDAIIIYAWLTLLEKDGKMSPDAQVIWNYSW